MEISETQIQRLATPNSYDRGEDYYRRGTILQPVRQGSILSAFCIGTALYEVTIAFNENEITNAQCSCPYNYGGLCKHCVALLLMWCREPESFNEVPTLQEALAKRSKTELIELVKAMVMQEPMLLSLISAPRLPTPDSLLPRINAALELPTARTIVEALQPFIELAGRSFDTGDIFYAGSLYCLLLSELTQSYDTERLGLDYNSELSDFSAVLVVGLRSCLDGEGIGEELQRLWLSALVETYNKSLDFGEYGYGADSALLSADPRILNEVVAEAKRRRLKGALSKLLERRDKSLEQILQEYRERAEKYINQRNRRSYRQAIKILKELHGICVGEDCLSAWLGCISGLRSRYGNLKAFLEEMDKVGFRVV